MKFIPAALAFSLLTACHSLPPQYAKSPTRSLVKGDDTGGTSVLIRKVDNSDILWTGNYTLGNKVWLEAGDHKVSVMCSTNTSYGSFMAGTEVDMKISRGTDYLLKVKPMKSVKETPEVEIVKISK